MLFLGEKSKLFDLRGVCVCVCVCVIVLENVSLLKYLSPLIALVSSVIFKAEKDLRE